MNYFSKKARSDWCFIPRGFMFAPFEGQKRRCEQSRFGPTAASLSFSH